MKYKFRRNSLWPFFPTSSWYQLGLAGLFHQRRPPTSPLSHSLRHTPLSILSSPATQYAVEMWVSCEDFILDWTASADLDSKVQWIEDYPIKKPGFTSGIWTVTLKSNRFHFQNSTSRASPETQPCRNPAGSAAAASAQAIGPTDEWRQPVDQRLVAHHRGRHQEGEHRVVRVRLRLKQQGTVIAANRCRKRSRNRKLAPKKIPPRVCFSLTCLKRVFVICVNFCVKT